MKERCCNLDLLVFGYSHQSVHIKLEINQMIYLYISTNNWRYLHFKNRL